MTLNGLSIEQYHLCLTDMAVPRFCTTPSVQEGSQSVQGRRTMGYA